MFADYLYVITDSLHGRRSNHEIDDRLLADMGLTRADLIKAKRWVGRKSARG